MMKKQPDELECKHCGVDNLFQDIKPGIYGELLCLSCRKMQQNETSKTKQQIDDGGSSGQSKSHP